MVPLLKPPPQTLKTLYKRLTVQFLLPRANHSHGRNPPISHGSHQNTLPLHLLVFNFLHPSFSTSKNPKNQSLISTPSLESRLTQSLFPNNQLSPQSTKTTTSPSNSQRNKPNNPKSKPRETKEKQSQRTKKNPSFFVYARNLQQPFSTTTNNNSNYKHKTATTFHHNQTNPPKLQKENPKPHQQTLKTNNFFSLYSYPHFSFLFQFQFKV